MGKFQGMIWPHTPICGYLVSNEEVKKRKTNTDGLAACVIEGVRVGVNDFAVNLVGPSTVVSNAAHGGGHVPASHHDALAIVQRLNGRERLRILLEQVGELEEIPGSLLGSDLFPFSLEGLSRCRNGDIDILLGSFFDGADDLFVGRVDGLNLLTLFACDPFVVNESGNELVSRCLVARIGKARKGGRCACRALTGPWVARTCPSRASRGW